MVEPESVAFVIEGVRAVRRGFDSECDTLWCCAGVVLRAVEEVEAYGEEPAG